MKRTRLSPLHLYGIFLIVAFGIYGITGLKGSITPYVSLRQAQMSRDRVQVKGKLETGSVHTDSLGRLVFDLVDFKTQRRFHVIFSGQHPANMAMARDVVVMGTWDPAHDCFQSDQMNIKCPDKYQPGAGKSP